MVFDSYLYGNPETILERKQESLEKRKAKCGKCAHYQTLLINNEAHHGCTLKRRNWQACTYFKLKRTE